MPVDEPARPGPPAAGQNPLELLRSHAYLRLLALSAVLGVPISALAYGYLALIHELELLTYQDLPRGLGFAGTPPWWPFVLLGPAGLVVGLTIRYLPGSGGHKPAEGLAVGRPPAAADLPGIALAALATLSLGAVLGPEGPLIALGGGTALAALRFSRKEIPDNARALIGAVGSFAAVSTLLGSPLLGAFLLMEASGLAGPLLGVVLVPGLLASGIGSLIFVGLNQWTGLGTYSLTLSGVPGTHAPDLAEFGWALAIGLAAAAAGAAIRRLALLLQGRVERRRVTATALLGVVVAALAVAYAAGTGKAATDVLYSGQTALDPLLKNHADYPAGALVLLVACKSLAFGASLSAFRGGPVFPAMFIGAAGGIALSHLPGLPLTAGFALGIGAMCTALLRLPLTSVLLATLLLGDPGLTVMPLVIVSVVVCYVALAWLAPAPTGGTAPAATRAG